MVIAVLVFGMQRIQVPRWLPEEWQQVYELTVANAEHALCLTSGTAAVHHRNAWWAVSAGHDHCTGQGSRGWFQDTMLASTNFGL